MEQVGNTFYRSLVKPFFFSLKQQHLFPFLLVFLSILVVSKLNQYIFFNFDTSPAIILLPSGIALAAIYLGGYRMWLPVLLAWFAAMFTSPASLPLLIVAVISFAQTMQAVLGGYILKRLGFLGTLGRTRCALILVGVSLILPTIAPTISTLTQWLTGDLTTSVWENWSRTWAGGVLSILVFTPLITTWYREHRKKTKRQFLESALSLFFLGIMVYVTFWTTLPQVNVFIVLYVFFAILFWIGLRMRPRITSTALFIVAAFGMAGSIIAHPNPAVSISQQLFANELFIILISPIFFILTALVEEKKANAQAALARAQELEEANKKLSSEDRAKNEFLATLAHELRNPLAPVVSSLELIKVKAKALAEPELIELTDVAATHNATLIQLIDDLLEVSRISQNKLKLKMEHVNLETVVRQAQRTVETLYQSCNHTLTVVIPKEDVWIIADPLRLEQILVNLLNNAANYTPSGGAVALTVTYHPVGGLRILIKDNGVGLLPSMFNSIFEPFMQFSNKGAGLGIGLSLAKRLVELHGGHIHVESDGPGKGSTFIINLPNTEPNEHLVARSRRRGVSLTEEQPSKKALSILVVDDNQAAADGLSKLLQHKGHSVLVAYDGQGAIEKMGGQVADVVLLDIGLPDMDGYEVARQLREIYGEEPLILVALTGFGQDEDKAKALAAGFDFHLTKPVGIADVEEILATEEVQSTA